jgi:hypothetical protein
MKVPAPVVAIGLAALVLLVGTALLQRGGTGGPIDLVASTTNGQPRGLLLLSLALSPIVVTDTAALVNATTVDAIGDLVVVVPPPEHSAFSTAEGEQLRQLAERGARVIVACDGNVERNRRLTALLATTGVACHALPTANDAASDAVVVDELAEIGPIQLLDRGRLVIDDSALGIVTLVTQRTTAADHPVVVSVGVGAGEFVVVGSMSVFANDGLQRANNARLLERLLGNRRQIVVDERHHRTRLSAVVGKARLQGPGPLTAALCALLLVPLGLLGLLPRRGERLIADTTDVTFTDVTDSDRTDISDDVMNTPSSHHTPVDARTAGLAAMLVRAGVSSRTTRTRT